MTSPSDDERWRDSAFDRKVDNLVILMSLAVTKSLIHRWKGNQRIARLVERRIDRLLKVYSNPEA